MFPADFRDMFNSVQYGPANKFEAQETFPDIVYGDLTTGVDYTLPSEEALARYARTRDDS